MKKFILTLLSGIFIFPSILFAQGTDIPAGDVSGTWTKTGSPYKILGDITIPQGQTLTIESGVKIEFQDHYMMNIKGNVRAIGSPGDTILFTVPDTNGFYNIESGTGGWNGIKIDNYEEDMGSSDSSVFRYCKFEYAKSITDASHWWSLEGGGAFYIRNFSKVLIRNCLFRINHARVGGGAIYAGSNTGPEIDHCAFIENEAHAGGAIYLFQGSNPFIHDCLFYKNNANYDGGAFWSHSGEGKIMNNIFSNNTAHENAGAIYIINSNETITGNLIVNNYTKRMGGGVTSAGSWPRFYNNHICYNHADTAGGGMQFWSLTNADYFNNIFWGNTQGEGGAKSRNQIFIESANSTPNFYNCIIQDGIAGIDDYTGKYENIIENYPVFTDTSESSGADADGLEADWTLSTTSPAINRGSNAIKDELSMETDLRGNPRIIHGILDIGAYEHRIDSISVSDTIAVNTMWIADTVRVTGDIVIKDNVTLNIAPGTFIGFQGYYGIAVIGTIIARGSEEYPIIFTVSDTTGCSSTVPDSGVWKGIVFDNSQYGANGIMNDNDSSILKYCMIDYVKYSPAIYSDPVGGAIRIRYFSNLEISDCSIGNNSSDDGAAIGIDMYAHPVISGNYIWGNLATHTGGGIFIRNKSKPLIINNYFTNNLAYYSAGGIGVNNASPVILNNVICNNAGGGGGGLCVVSSKPVFSNNTVCNNWAYVGGGGLYEFDSEFDIYNSLFWGNTSENQSREQIFLMNQQNFYHNNIQGGKEGMDLSRWEYYERDYIGNIDEDPALINPTEKSGFEAYVPLEDWSITDFSPNINKGFPESDQLNLPDKDIAGKNRIRHEIVDIGAFENQGEPIHIIMEPYNQIACMGDTIEFSVEVEGNALFQWLKNGEEITGADTNMLQLDSITMNDMADYICIIKNGYGMLLSNNVTLEVNSPPEILLLTESQWVKEDDNLKLEIHARGTEPVFYEWLKDGAPIQQEMMPEFRIDKMSYEDEGSYVCQISNRCGYMQSAPITLYVAPQICIVTVDTITGGNLIVWEKNSTAPITYFNIYRESNYAGIYDKIESVPYDQLSVYTDTVADPTSRAYLYKITAIDTSGYETDLDLCKTHKTIHLLVTTHSETYATQLSWDHYSGFDFGTYAIFRSDTIFNFSVIDSISSSSSSWSDPNPGTGVKYYRVAALKPEPCTVTGNVSGKADSGPYSHSMSNMEDNRIQVTGLNELYNVKDITIFPNPFNDRTTIRFPDSGDTPYTMRIMDLTGKVIRTLEITGQSEFILYREGLESGYYLIELRGEKLFRGKIIVE
ncbi:MAG: hypothetical protein AMS27_15635 [Bacteroides sp. SM23_62_1]|nr:MAG: hypothetical protein AMS27_15635 [Bacteroides sp. SM23_62_1]